MIIVLDETSIRKFYLEFFWMMPLLNFCLPLLSPIGKIGADVAMMKVKPASYY